MQSDEFALNAFKYELANHEFVITYDYEDALDALELEYSELDSRLLNLLKKAKEQYLKNLMNIHIKRLGGRKNEI
ncbi:TPA: hypothetical protein PTC43_002520, partial [Staphylococcus pseudintermedius]|nr:hypothetical protein [Staphylococcus pseudintermedius]